ncbi:MAG: Eco57I restriction-modification methylase domain-containing protein, partial [Bacteroidales bacterium]|nr:Eco57I restriction-modification methylase domain-containing protein [Bacteroidales bacterium]
LNKWKGELIGLTNQNTLFELTAKQKKEFNIKVKTLTEKIKKQEVVIEEIKNNRIYENAFEWRFEFPEVLNDEGDFIGFDVVIGNPPYVNAMELKKFLSEAENSFYKKNYVTAKGSVDLYIYFFELGFILLKKQYYLSFITPNRFLSASYGLALREFLLNKTSLLTIGDYSNVSVFKEASTYPITTLFQKIEDKHSLKSFTFVNEREPLKFRIYLTENLYSLNEYILGFVLSEKYNIVRKVISQSVSLSECGVINATSTAKEADEFNSLINECNGFKLINTGTIDKYATTWGRSYLMDKRQKFLMPYLPKSENALGRNRFDLYSKPKIIFAKIAITPEAFYDENGEYASINTNCIHSFSEKFIPEYILAWVNSKLFQYLFECFFDGLKMAGGYLLYSSPNLINTYIKQAEKLQQEKIAEIVRQIIDISKATSTDDIEHVQSKINMMFYELYGLSDEEIAIVEAKL